MSELERTRKLRETIDEQKDEINQLKISLLNAEAIAQTLVHHGETFDELHELVNKLAGRLANLEKEVGNQKTLIVKSLQQKYGTGPTA